MERQSPRLGCKMANLWCEMGTLLTLMSFTLVRAHSQCCLWVVAMMKAVFILSSCTSVRILSMQFHTAVRFLKSTGLMWSFIRSASPPCSHWWLQTPPNHAVAPASPRSSETAQPNGGIMAKESLLKYSTCLWGCLRELTACVPHLQA